MDTRDFYTGVTSIWLVMSKRSVWVQDTRGVSEIIFVALLTLVVAGIGVAGVALASDITADTAQQSDDLDFELTSISDIMITYEDGPVLTSSNTQRLTLIGGNDEHVIYDSSDGGDFRPGQIALSSFDAANLEITNDMTVQIVWTQADGDSKTVETIYIPDERLQGTVISSNGSVSVDGEMDFDMW